jgi:hypothetical protein
MPLRPGGSASRPPWPLGSTARSNCTVITWANGSMPRTRAPAAQKVWKCTVSARPCPPS